MTGAVPLGSSVKIASGINQSLGYLLDCNNATYSIKSGSAWHLLYIIASFKSDPDSPEQGTWVFKMESDTVSNAAFAIKNNNAAYMSDSIGKPIMDTPGTRAQDPLISENYLDPESLKSLESVGQSMGYPLMGPVNTYFDYYDYWSYYSTLQERGNHIYPIAYHRITPDGAQIVQIARSDWHFWPVPNLPIYGKTIKPLQVRVGLSTSTTEGGTPPDPDAVG